MLLDGTSEKIDVVLGSTPSTELDFMVSYMVDDGSSLTAENNDGTTSGTTDVAVVGSPGSGEQHLIKWLTVYNPSGNSAVDVTLKMDDGTDEQKIVTRNLGADETLEYSDGQWRIAFSSGGSSYTDEDAQDAVGNNFGTGLNYDDATPDYSLDESVLKDGGAKEIDASEFAGSSGTDGQVLTSTGSAAQWESAGGASELSDLSDASVSTPSDGDLLIYNNGTSQFENETLNADDIGDVSADSNSSAHHSKTSSASEISDVSPDTTSDAHHSKTSSASELSDVSADSVSDAHHAATVATDLNGTGLNASGGNLVLDEATLKDGGSKELDVADLAGGDGTSGQIPKTDGAAVTWNTMQASDISDVSADSVSDAHHAATTASDLDGTGTTASGGNLDLDEAVIKDGGAKEVDADELAGGNGTSGQFIRTDGSALSYVTPSASDISDVSADSVSDAHHAQTTATDLDGDGTTASGGNLDLDEAVIKDGGTKEIDASEFAGSSGTDGQVLTSTGSAAQWESPSGGGSAITYDINNDDSNESTDLTEIATANEPSSPIASEPTADKARFDWSNITAIAGVGNYEVLDSVTGASNSTVDLVGMGTTYDYHLLIIDNPGHDNSNNQTLFLRTSSDGGSTFDSGSFDYTWHMLRDDYQDNSKHGYGDDSKVAIIGVDDGVPQYSNNRSMAQVVITGAADTGTYTSFLNQSFSDENGSPNHVRGVGVRKEAAAHDGLRLVWSNGSFNSGNLYLIGVQR